MAARVPTTTSTNWAATALHLLILACLAGLAVMIGVDLIWGAIVYLTWSWGSRLIVTREHRAGIRHVKAGRFAEAIPHFERSAALFQRNAWVDRYRAVVLLSPSNWGYREMGLANIAFCQGQLGNGKEAIALYESLLAEYPGSTLAETPLRMMRAAQAT